MLLCRRTPVAGNLGHMKGVKKKGFGRLWVWGLQVYLAEAEPRDMHSGEEDLQLWRCRVAGRSPVTCQSPTRLRCFPQTAGNKGKEQEVTKGKGKSDELLLDLC